MNLQKNNCKWLNDRGINLRNQPNFNETALELVFSISYSANSGEAIFNYLALMNEYAALRPTEKHLVFIKDGIIKNESHPNFGKSYLKYNDQEILQKWPNIRVVRYDKLSFLSFIGLISHSEVPYVRGNISLSQAIDYEKMFVHESESWITGSSKSGFFKVLADSDLFAREELTLLEKILFLDPSGGENQFDAKAAAKMLSASSFKVRFQTGVKKIKTEMAMYQKLVKLIFAYKEQVSENKSYDIKSLLRSINVPFGDCGDYMVRQ